MFRRIPSIQFWILDLHGRKQPAAADVLADEGRLRPLGHGFTGEEAARVKELYITVCQNCVTVKFVVPPSTPALERVAIDTDGLVHPHYRTV
jgi:hypothetical protein